MLAVAQRRGLRQRVRFFGRTLMPLLGSTIRSTLIETPQRRPRRWALLIVAAALLADGAYLLAWPISLEPRVWTPTPLNAALLGQDASLDSLERLAEPAFSGAETLLPQGRYLYAASAEGGIQRLELQSGAVAEVARAPTRGRGLLRAGRDGFVVADREQGLVHVDDKGATTLLRAYRDQPLKAVQDLALSRDGWIYFSNASTRHDADHVDDARLEHAGDGQVLRYYDLSNEVQLVLGGLDRPAGIAFGPEDRYVLIAEQGRYRVLRHWLAGERAGQSETFIDGLPGEPHGLRWNGRDRFWLTLSSARNTRYDAAAASPGLRRFYARLPQLLRPGAPAPAWVLGLDLEGRVVHRLQSEDTGFAPVTSAVEHRGWLYLGSDRADGIARWRLPEDAAGKTTP